MNCDLACHLIDDYLEDELSQRDRQRLEAHLARCPRCSKELRGRPVFERTVQRALAASVQPLRLSADVSMTMIQAAESSLHRAIWSKRAMGAIRGMATAVATVLVLIGLYFLVSGSPLPSGLRSLALFPVDRFALSDLNLVTLLPAKRLPLSEQHPVTLSTGNEPAARSTAPSLVSLANEDVLLEPWNMRPGEPFTITLFLHSDLPEPLDTVRLNLDVSGPAGYHRFAMSVEGPFPTHGVSIVRVTPDLLAAACREKYLMSPTDLFGVEGVYTVRVTLFSPVLGPES